MTFGVCDMPEADIAPAPATKSVAHDSSFANLESGPVPLQWLFISILVAILLQL